MMTSMMKARTWATTNCSAIPYSIEADGSGKGVGEVACTSVGSCVQKVAVGVLCA